MFYSSMLNNLKNGQLARREFIYQKKKKNFELLLKILAKEGFILGYKITSTKIKIFLKYKDQRPVINTIKVLSKPGHRIYYSIKQIWKIHSNKYFIIFSTNQGLKSIIDCKKLKIGGEPIIMIN